MLQKVQTKALLLRLSATAPRSGVFRHSPRGAPARLVQARDRVAPICTSRTCAMTRMTAGVHEGHRAPSGPQQHLDVEQRSHGSRWGQLGEQLAAQWSTCSEIESSTRSSISISATFISVRDHPRVF